MWIKLVLMFCWYKLFLNIVFQHVFVNETEIYSDVFGIQIYEIHKILHIFSRKCDIKSSSRFVMHNLLEFLIFRTVTFFCLSSAYFFLDSFHLNWYRFFFTFCHLRSQSTSTTRLWDTGSIWSRILNNSKYFKSKISSGFIIYIFPY